MINNEYIQSLSSRKESISLEKLMYWRRIDYAEEGFVSQLPATSYVL